MLRRIPLVHSFRKLSSLFSHTTSFNHSSCKRSPLSFAPKMEPPVAKKIPSVVSAHGTTWVDPYRWMSNKDDPELLDHLLKENSYTEAFMADTRDLQRKLVAEMESRMPPSISTPPERWGPWIYYQYIPDGMEYPILCRRLICHNGLVKTLLNCRRSYGEEEILLNWNEIAEQHGYVHIGTCRISPNHKLLAYTLDPAGSEMFMLRIKDLTNGYTFSDSRVMGVVSLAWSKDSSCLFYTVCDEAQRPYRLFCKKLGSDAVDDLLFTEKDVSCCLDIASTKDGKFITINSNSRASSEVYVMDATNLGDGFWLVRKRVPGVQYFLEHHDGFFYILTNAPLESHISVAGGYHLARCKAGKLSLGIWQDVIVPGPGITFQDMDVFHGHLVLFVQKKEAATFCSINMSLIVDIEEPVNVEELNPWFFPLPSNFCNVVPCSNHDFMSTVYRVVVSSPVMPDAVVDYDLVEKKFTIVHQDEVVGLPTTRASLKESSSQTYTFGVKSHDDQHLRGSQVWSDLSETFLCERKEVVSHDGLEVPLTIVYSRETELTGQSPGLLYGYGAYGEVLDKSWSTDQMSLLARGWIIAYADVRGGGEMSWHRAGTKLGKLNSIYDFAACGMYLVDKGYVHKNSLAAIGCSAGGLLVSAAINKYPDLFRAAILKVPFLDICNTMLDPTLPLTILDYDEFGDPRVETEFETIREYSPYDNIVPQVCYPSALVTASVHDSRVGVWEAPKWVSRVRESTCPTCSRSVILKTNMSGGHFSEGGRHSHCEDAAFEYAFLIKVMGLLDGENQTEAI